MKSVSLFRLTFLAAFSLFASFCNLRAQADDVVSYFKETLAADTLIPSVEKGRISLKKVSKERQKAWRAWQQAVRESHREHLGEACPLDSVAPRRLSLPSEPEPQAVMPYYWGTKGGSKVGEKDTLPTFVYLHGSGPKSAEWQTGLKLAKRFEDAPSHYFIPQIPNEGAYYRWWQRAKQWAWRWLWRELTAVQETDPDRLCLFGISEGGYGSQRLASFYADYLAAAGPMAGGEPLQNAPAENLQHVAFSFLTGAEDRTFCRNVYTQITGQALDSLQKQCPDGYVHRVELVPGRGHSIDYSPTTPWLRPFVRNPRPRNFVWEDFAMDGQRRKGFYNLRIDKRPASDYTRYEVAVDSAKGQVDITVSDVEYIPLEQDSTWGFTLTLRWHKRLAPSHGGAFTLYLDETLVNLKRPVTVRVNGREVFKGRVRLSRSNLLESLATFADPQRIFPAAVTVRY